MGEGGFITLLIILVTGFISYKGFKNPLFLEAYSFQVERVLVHREYKRLVTSGFLHVGWLHLIFNMISLYAFSHVLEYYIGPVAFLLIYFAGLVGGNLLALFIQRRNSAYSAVGASGAVNGIIFATIALFPGMKIGFFILPLSIPSWLYGILFVAFTIWGIRARRDGIGHEAHLGGALIGMFTALLLVPQAFMENLLPILLVTVPTLAFLALLVYRPHILLVDRPFASSSTRRHHYSVDHRWNESRASRQQEIDRILDKIGRRGMESLTAKEKQLLKEYSKDTPNP